MYPKSVPNLLKAQAPATVSNDSSLVSKGKNMTERPKKKRSSTPAQRSAGAANLAEFRSGNSKPALDHGIHTAIASGSVPPVEGATDIAAKVDAILGEMQSDLGGNSEITAQRKAILESQRLCLLVLGLASTYLRREGLVNSAGKPHPLLSVVVSYANCLRLNGLALGLDRRQKPVPELAEVLHEIAENRDNH
jgi:hypothetical protein